MERNKTKSEKLSMVQVQPNQITKVGSMSAEAALEIVEGMHEGGINFVSLLPESEFLTAQHAIMKDDRFTCVPVCNEGSGICICAGAWAGGKKPAIMMGAAGFTVASYALAGVSIRHGVPTLLLITSRELGDQNWIFSIWNAYTLEPFLKSFGFPYTKVTKINEVRKTIRDSAKTSLAWLKPVAVIMTGEVIF
jgi:sulfopyruvate decarboxylase subunit alpha